MPALPPNIAAKKPSTTVVHRPTRGLTPATKEKETASGTIARETAKPAVMAVKYFVRSVGFVRSIFLPKEVEMDLALATILSICEGGTSTDSSLDTLREIPRKGVPEIGVDFPLAPPLLFELLFTTSNRFFGGLALEMGRAG